MSLHDRFAYRAGPNISHPPACTCVKCLRAVRIPIEEPARFSKCESYLGLVCATLDIKKPFLFFNDALQNSGACGEAGQTTIWLQKQHVLKSNWADIEDTIRHEVAHIVVHNGPEGDEAPAHGREFQSALKVVQAKTEGLTLPQQGTRNAPVSKAPVAGTNWGARRKKKGTIGFV